MRWHLPCDLPDRQIAVRIDPMEFGAAGLLAALGLVAALATGCSRQPGALSDQGPASSQQLPFDDSSDKNGISPTASLALGEVPGGTPITVRMESAVSSATAHAGDSFHALLDEPIIVQGRTIAPRGAAVSGRFLAAKASGRLQEPGYLRITLTAISVSGRSLALQTSSIFVKGGSHEQRNLLLVGGGSGGGAGSAIATGKRDIELPAERQLTFRLTQALPVPR
jgi:hypothetical protein